MLFDDTLGWHQENSSSDDQMWNQPIDLSSELGKGHLGKPYSEVKPTQTLHFPVFFFTTTMLDNHSG